MLEVLLNPLGLLLHTAQVPRARLLAGSLFARHPTAPFWMAAFVLLLGAGASFALWGTARDDEISLLAALEVERDGRLTLAWASIRCYLLDMPGIASRVR